MKLRKQLSRGLGVLVTRFVGGNGEIRWRKTRDYGERPGSWGRGRSEMKTRATYFECLSFSNEIQMNAKP